VAGSARGGEKELKIEDCKLKIKSGFTMIELLIVIAVLGILAVAVLSAINPIEQINRSRDTGSRSDAEQLISAVDRFYAANGYYPWMTSADDEDEDTGWVEVGDDWTDGTDTVLENLSGVGTEEIKTSFVNRLTGSDYNSLYVYNEGTQGDSTYVCFEPQSANFTKQANDRAGTDCGDLPDDLSSAGCANICAGSGDDLVCFSCLP